MENCTDKSCNEKDKICIPDVKLPRIVVVGGGFAGINLAKELHGAPYQVVMLDENNYHQFSPLLYQIATSGIEPDSIVFPFRKLFRNSDKMVFRMTKAVKVDPKKMSCIQPMGPSNTIIWYWQREVQPITLEMKGFKNTDRDSNRFLMR
jgi:NADH dehydrogenase